MPTYPLDEAPGFWLHLAFNRMRAFTVRALLEEGFDLSPEQWALLVRLWQEDGRTQSELAEATFRDKAAVTRLIDGLERQGFVRREPDSTDRRVKRIVLTAEGQALEDRLVPFIKTLVEHIFHGISLDERRTLVDLLRRMYQNMEE